MLNAIRSEASRFENVLQSLRVSRGKSWTREKTAQLLTDYDGHEVKTRLYTGWETGEGVPSLENLQKIVAVLGLNQDEEEKLYIAAARVPPKKRHLPFPPNPYFTGRRSYLKQLRQFLQENGTLALTQPVSISGLGGIGKTQLALAYAYLSYPKSYRVVLWVNAADSTTLQTDYDTLARELGLPVEHAQEPYQRVRAVKQWLDDHTHWLLIMDNADDLEHARSFFPEVTHGHILLTTRSQFAGKIGARQLEIDKMKRAEGLVFLLRRTRKLEGDAKLNAIAADIRKSALELVTLLDGHPLALDQAGAYIEETGASFTEYIDLYREARSRLLRKYGALGTENEGKYREHPETVVVTFELCFEMAQKLHPLAAEILNFCAFLHPDTIPEELFQHIESFKVDRDTFNSGIAALRQYSLIRHNGHEKTFSMHRLVQAVLIDAILPDLQKQWRERVVRALNAAFPEVKFEVRRQCERLLPHALVCATWTEEKLPSTVVVARLFHQAGSYLHEKANYSAMEIAEEDMMTKNRQYRFEHHGTERPWYEPLGSLEPDNLRRSNEVADLYHKRDARQIEPLILRALSIRETHLGTEHPDTANSLCSLAAHYHRQGNNEQAEVLYRRALEIFEKCLGAEHSSIALPLSGLVGLLKKQGQHEQAEAMQLRALAALLGIKHPQHLVYERVDDAEDAAQDVSDEPSV